MDSLVLFISLCSLFSFVLCNKPCSREGSRLVRDYFTRALGPIYEKNHIAIPLECVLSPMRDLYYRQELNKMRISNDKWLCKYCNKTFLSEYYLDLHLVNRHNNTLLQNDQTVCLAEYCSIFRCDVLKQPKKSLRSLNPLARGATGARRKTKKVISEQQLASLRTICTSVINRCIPSNVNYDTRVKLQNQMHAEVCAFLTSKKYFELPSYLKSVVNFTSIFCLVILIGTCLVGIGVVTHSDWKLDDPEEFHSKRQGSNSSVSSASTPLSTVASNGVSHSPKTGSTSVRQRVRFKSHDSECQHDHPHPHHE